MVDDVPVAARRRGRRVPSEGRRPHAGVEVAPPRSGPLSSRTLHDGTRGSTVGLDESNLVNAVRP